LAAVVALSLAGCSGEDKATPKASPGSTSSPSSPEASPAALKDESAAVLGWTPPAPVAKTEGKLGTFTRGEMVPATAEIISVQANDASTILIWQLSSATDIPLQGATLSADTVRLVDPVGKKSYAINVMGDDNAGVVPLGVPGFCVCSAHPIHVGPDPVRMTAAYPALRASATSISVRIPNFAPVTVPLTR